MNEISLLKKVLVGLEKHLKQAESKERKTAEDFEFYKSRWESALEHVHSLRNEIDNTKSTIENLEKILPKPITEHTTEQEKLTPVAKKKLITLPSNADTTEKKPKKKKKPNPELEKKPTKKPQFDETESKIMKMLSRGKQVSATAIMKRFNLSEDDVFNIFTKLRKKFRDEGDARMITGGSGGYTLKILDERKYKVGKHKAVEPAFNMQGFINRAKLVLDEFNSKRQLTKKQLESQPGKRMLEILEYLKGRINGVNYKFVNMQFEIRHIYHYLNGNRHLVPPGQLLVCRNATVWLYSRYNPPIKDKRVNRLLYALNSGKMISMHDASMASFVDKGQEMGEVIILANFILAKQKKKLKIDGEYLVVKSTK